MSIQFDNLLFSLWLMKRGMMRLKVRNLVVDYLSLLRVGKKIRRRRKRLMRGERGRLLLEEVEEQRWRVSREITILYVVEGVHSLDLYSSRLRHQVRLYQIQSNFEERTFH